MRSGLRDELENVGKRLVRLAESEARPEPSDRLGHAADVGCGLTPTADPEYILKELFTYHAPDEEQQKQYQTIRDAALHLALVMVKNSPPGADQKEAILLLREAVMLVNSAIANRGNSF